MKGKLFLGKDLDKNGVENFYLPEKNLTTHCLVLGASGTGKTVMCKSMIEEALLNDIPVIAIDPKGDIGALGICFDTFEVEQIRPFVKYEALDSGRDENEIIQEVIGKYTKELTNNFGTITEAKAMMTEYNKKVRVLIVTPNSTIGNMISNVPDFEKPSEKLTEEQIDEYLDINVQILLELCRYRNLSSTDKKAVFLKTLIEYLWNEGNATIPLDLLVDSIIHCPIESVGLIELEKFINAKTREQLANAINSLLLNTQKGLPFDIERLFKVIIKEKSKLNELNEKFQESVINEDDLQGIEEELDKQFPSNQDLGLIDESDLESENQKQNESEPNKEEINVTEEKVKVAPLIVFDLRTIPEESDKHNFVASVLNAVHTWIWAKGGTNRLRAILYFDEIYGMMPPIVKTACKNALLTLLKQARSFGLGIILATQNPGDLDYRGLGNIETWIVGRLTSATDLAKIKGGLKANMDAMNYSDKEFAEIFTKISGLQPGDFIVFGSKIGFHKIRARWLITYHKGPLVPDEINLISVKPTLLTEKRIKPSKQKEKERDKEKEKEIDLDSPKLEFESEDLFSDEEKKRTKKKQKKIASESSSSIVDFDIKSQIEEIQDIQFEKREKQIQRSKPPINKYSEMFIIPQIKPEAFNILPILNHRLGIKDNSRILLELLKSVVYYEPLLYYNIEIAVSKSFTIGNIEFPLKFQDTFVRMVSVKESPNIDWERNSVEDIYPDAMDPSWLQPLGDPSIDSYLQFTELNPKKVEDNLKFFIPKQQRPQTDRILKKALIEAKNNALAKLRKRMEPGVKKLTFDLDAKGSRAETIQLKLEELQQKKKALENEKRLKIELGKSPKQTEISLNSVEKQISQWESKLKAIELEKEKIISEIKAVSMESGLIEENFLILENKVGKSADFNEFYSPNPNNIKLNDRFVYWLPRILVFLKISKNGTLLNYLTVDLNLVNGDGHIECSICGDLSCNQCEVSCVVCPPRVLCNECGRPVCLDHVGFCESCGVPIDSEHLRYCDDCKKITCSDCAKICDICGKILDQTCTYECQNCKRIVCLSCAATVVSLDKKKVIDCKQCKNK